MSETMRDGTRSKVVHVLAIDDSAVVREALRLSLAYQPGIRLTVAPDAVIGELRMRQDPPDVVLLDLELPRVHGLAFLEQLMDTNPLPVVICSAAPADGDLVLRALALGAVDVVRKPSLDLAAFAEAAGLLADSVRAAAAAKGRLPARARTGVAARTRSATPRPESSRPAPPAPEANAPKLPIAHTPSPFVIALGASTGGTEALLQVLRELPVTIPGVLVVQHMPPPYTAPFAARLDRACRIAVREAVDGDRVEHGLALIAPGGRHMRLCRKAGLLAVEVFDGPLVSRHRPSVDVLFHSVATAASAGAVGAILTGMGDDGAAGLHAMRTAGAITFAQDEQSCVVNGMPARARERGAVMSVVPLSAMASHLVEASENLRGRNR
jgi:two-component system chemotaxis response regulator CheB